MEFDFEERFVFQGGDGLAPNARQARDLQVKADSTVFTGEAIAKRIFQAVVLESGFVCPVDSEGLNGFAEIERLYAEANILGGRTQQRA